MMRRVAFPGLLAAVALVLSTPAALAQDAATPAADPAPAEAAPVEAAPGEAKPETQPVGAVEAKPLVPPPGAEAEAGSFTAQAMAVPASESDLPMGRRPLVLKDRETVNLPIGQSMLVRLPERARDIMVANPEVADVMVRRQTQVFLVGRTAGSTNIFFLDNYGTVIQEAEVRVNVDTRALKDTLANLMGDHGIKVEAVGDTIYLAGSVRSDAAAARAVQVATRFVAAPENVVNLLSVKEEQQVLLRVRVAEVQKTALKELGVQLSGSNNNSNFTVSGTALSNFFSSTVPFATGTLTSVPELGGLGVTLSALERQGLIRTLAEPNLTAVSGETANLLAGGEYPIPVAEQNGRIIIEYKPFGIGLAFTPVVVGEGQVSLKLSAEASAIDDTIQVTTGTGIEVNGLKVRRAETTVEMPSGGSLMIAGMLQNDITQTVNGLPWLKDIPILGGLFRSDSFQKNQSELVVMVSAYIVESVDNNRLALPTDGLQAPSDLDLYLLGRLHKVYAGGGPPPKEAVVGPVGYIVQ